MKQQRELIAAREEIASLDKLAQGVSSKIKELATKRPRQVSGQLVELSLNDIHNNMRKGYEELAHHVYGRTVIGGEIDEDGKPIGTFLFRITQANVSYLEDGCAVLARNAPVASQLVTAQPGEEREIAARNRHRYFGVDEVRTFDGPTSLVAPAQKPDFRSMAIRRVGTKRPLVLEYLRAAIAVEQIKPKPTASPFPAQPATPASPRQPAVPSSPIAIPSDSRPQPAAAPAEVAMPASPDPTWLTDWKGIFLGTSETLSLGHQFFTRTTTDQENTLNVPRGLTFVEGIAGAGKTSVALGRLKFFSNFGTGQFLDSYGLQASPVTDFSPIGMIGFVLSHSLKRYLRDTATALDLGRLPIKDFDEFRMELTTQYGLTKAFRLRNVQPLPIRTRMAWLRGVDAAAARVAGANLRTLARTSEIPDRILGAIYAIADDLERAEPRRDRLHLYGLAGRLARAIAEVELRERETEINETYRRESEFDRDRALRRAQENFERGGVSPLVRRLLGMLLAPNLFTATVAREDFSAIIQQAFAVDNLTNPELPQEVDRGVDGLRTLLSERDEEGRGCLTESDLIILISLAGLIAAGFDNPEVQAGTLSHLYDMRRHTAVFIDEVQDFTEIQVFLMGLTASDQYDQITLSGDRFQRLQADGAASYDQLFPLVPRARQNRSVFLDINFRQREELAFLSAAVRQQLQGDQRISVPTGIPSAVHTFHAPTAIAQLILKRIKTVPSYATIAVICGSKTEARTWYDLLEQDLAAEHRPALLSERGDLTRRFDVHFTDARETKGLEFDVVIVPDLGAFALHTLIGRNEAYVAISRAKHALLLGCNLASSRSPEIDLLVRAQLLRLTSI